MLDEKNCCLVLVDVQEKLSAVMHNKEKLFEKLATLVKGAKALDLPIIWCEQNPAKLGPTIEPLKEILSDQQPIAKMSFSCLGSSEFNDTLKSTGKEQVLICGIESHICVYQTAMDFINSGYEVTVVIDAISSRNEQDRDTAINRLSNEGVNIGSVEMVLFELLRTAEHPNFKEIAKLIK